MLEGRARTKKRIGCASVSEDFEQIRTVVYLQKLGHPYFAIPNGGSRNMKEAVKMKRTGTISGIPDLCVPVMRSGYGALFLELKREKGGSLSDNQRYWIGKLRELGYRAEVCHGFDEAKKVIDDYFEVSPGLPPG